MDIIRPDLCNCVGGRDGEKSEQASPWRPEVRTVLACQVILIPKWLTFGFPGAGWFMAVGHPGGRGVGAGSEWDVELGWACTHMALCLLAYSLLLYSLLSGDRMSVCRSDV